MRDVTPNRKAFMDTLSYSEGTSMDKHPTTQWDGYDVIVTGEDRVPELFTDFSQHPFAATTDNPAGRPPKRIRPGLSSTASGRYQFMRRDWLYYKNMLALPDFGPESQDQWCLQLIAERRALDLIDAGDIQQAIYRCKNLWASLPGAGYGQHENSIGALIAYYQQVGGSIA